LGLFPGGEYGTRELQLQPGETLLVYTDGFTEAMVADAALRRASRLPAGELLAACRREMETFLAGTPRGDDLTLLALRRVAA
jgi:sigma-B regulation protein RsbU (phosphoserine phosphatase)